MFENKTLDLREWLISFSVEKRDICKLQKYSEQFSYRRSNAPRDQVYTLPIYSSALPSQT